MKFVLFFFAIFSNSLLAQICPEDVDVIAPKLLLERGYGINTKEFPTQFIYQENLKKADLDLKDPACFDRNFKEFSKKISKDYQFEHIEIYENYHPTNPNQKIATFIVRFYDDSRTDQFLSMSDSQFDSNEPTAMHGRPADYICYAHIQFECALMDSRKVDQGKRNSGMKSIESNEQKSEKSTSKEK